ncbi:hypothetical protein HPB48_009208 [Haemaphysalis longicornis]|uniref:GH18 domain-containing protein n=1 Tax=Haemaphysalis longicornis TaxID=44386 RepID=A0A9J6G6G0_HAELO|nr:hypothetical protein HPB48_009208 [Haemaphysalis longicornis]
MSEMLEDQELLLHQSLVRSFGSRGDPFIKTCITYTGAGCVLFTLMLIGVFICVIAYDVRKADSPVSAVFPLNALSQRQRAVPIMCHVNTAQFYGPDASQRPGDIPGSYCSHLVLPLRGLLSAANDSWDMNSAFTEMQTRLTEFRDVVNESFPHLKHLVSVGDENSGGRLPFHEGHNASVYMTFLVELARWVLQSRLHGIVLNRVFPVETEYRQPMVVFLSHFKRLMRKHGLLFVVTTTLHTGIFKPGLRPRRLAKFFDYFGIVTQGLYRAANASEHILVPFHQQRSSRTSNSVEDAFSRAIRSGLPRSRVLVVISLAAYVCALSKTLPKDEVPTWSSTRAVRAGSYHEVCQLVRNENWSVAYDQESEKPHARRSNLWIGYENERSVRKMASLVNRMFLGGVIIVDVGSDDTVGRCGVPNPLVRAIFSEVEGTPVDDNETSSARSSSGMVADANASLAFNTRKTDGAASKVNQ